MYLLHELRSDNKVIVFHANHCQFGSVLPGSCVVVDVEVEDCCVAEDEVGGLVGFVLEVLVCGFCGAGGRGIGIHGPGLQGPLK